MLYKTTSIAALAVGAAAHSSPEGKSEYTSPFRLQTKAKQIPVEAPAHQQKTAITNTDGEIGSGIFDIAIFSTVLTGAGRGEDLVRIELFFSQRRFSLFLNKF